MRGNCGAPPLINYQFYVQFIKFYVEKSIRKLQMLKLQKLYVKMGRAVEGLLQTPRYLPRSGWPNQLKDAKNHWGETPVLWVVLSQFCSPKSFKPRQA